MSERPVLFVINSLAGGGAERIFASIVTHLAGSLDAPIEIVLLDKDEEHYCLGADLPKTVLGAKGSMSQSVALLTAYARKRRPRAIVSFLARANCAAIVAGYATGAPVVISERVHTSSHFSGRSGSRVNKAAVRALYPRAARVIAVSQGVADDLTSGYGVPSSKITTINNPVDLDAIRAAGAKTPPLALPAHFIAASGRLVAKKNFAMLIRAYAAAGLETPLIILGEGPERMALEILKRELGVDDRVLLPGYLSNPFAVIARADLFVSASNAEGFPNALIEAMALARPVIATDCPAGPAEILAGETREKTRFVREARWGVLTPVNHEPAMTTALSAFDEDKRTLYSVRAAERAGHFSAQRALDRYRAVICEVIHERVRPL